MRRFFAILAAAARNCALQSESAPNEGLRIAAVVSTMYAVSRTPLSIFWFYAHTSATKTPIVLRAASSCRGHVFRRRPDRRGQPGRFQPQGIRLARRDAHYLLHPGDQ